MSTLIPIQKPKTKPEQEDFGHKYTEEGRGKIGGKLIANYFTNVRRLFEASGMTEGRAIELGCGEGFSTQRLRQILPASITLDASEYLASLVPLAKTNNPGVCVTQESIYDLQHPPNSYDLVFLLEVLEHLDYPDQALEQITRVLNPGGLLILGVPREPLWRALNMARGAYLKTFGNTTGHLNHWNKRSLIKFVGRHFGLVTHVKTPLPWTIVLAEKRLAAIS